jgi:hypothetical protein
MFMQTLEKRMFKKTPAGYIFQFPPSRFRRTDAVLVTAAQKEEILAITRKSSPGMRFLPLLAALAMGILAGRTAGAISDLPTFGSALFGFGVGFATLIAAIEFAWRESGWLCNRYSKGSHDLQSACSQLHLCAVDPSARRNDALHDRKVGRLGAFEDLFGHDADLTIHLGHVGSVAHQPAGFAGAPRHSREKRLDRLHHSVREVWHVTLCGPRLSRSAFLLTPW